MKRIEICKASNINFSEVVEIHVENMFMFLTDLHKKYGTDLIVEWLDDDDLFIDRNLDLRVTIYNDYIE